MRRLAAYVLHSNNYNPADLSSAGLFIHTIYLLFSEAKNNNTKKV
ncbi:hypothetical protein KL86DYS1_10113 [uncultured Dysgonomonas sp.]|uniref:Uncharacterized protein n=1 Tax=uncultured Dysgonomonas sp. TaxID=206096 RepID=A0A212IUK2_9BACT|nr:hypothetical protein KL86DYS1_10113 [uncultured Dysgonomonas sp.]